MLLIFGDTVSVAIFSLPSIFPDDVDQEVRLDAPIPPKNGGS
jgi:hypothetical protein